MKQARVLTKEEIRKVIKVCELTRHADRNKLIVHLSFLSGMRAIEIANLRVKDVLNADNEVLDAIALNKTQTKGNKAQTVYVGKALKKELIKYFAKFPKFDFIKTTDVFFNLFNNTKNSLRSYNMRSTGIHVHVSKKPLSTLQIGKMLEFVNIRKNRDFITELSEKGVSVRVIQELARHSSLQTTQRYIDVSVPKLKGAVDLIGV